jgi:hypothetical protein
MVATKCRVAPIAVLQTLLHQIDMNSGVRPLTPRGFVPPVDVDAESNLAGSLWR